MLASRFLSLHLFSIFYLDSFIVQSRNSVYIHAYVVAVSFLVLLILKLCLLHCSNRSVLCTTTVCVAL